MNWGELMVFIVLMGVGQASPGADMILLTRTAIAEGARSALWMAAGVACGLILHSSVALGGTAYLIESNRSIYVAMLSGAAFYLVWIAVMLTKGSFRDSLKMFRGVEQRKSLSAGKSWRRGFLCNVLNLKVMVFLSTMSMPFLSGDRPDWWPWLLASIIVVEGFVLWSLWVLILQNRLVQSTYRKSWRWIDRLFALSLVVLAVSLVKHLIVE